MEGIDGAGKSAVAEAVISVIEGANYEVVRTREVGGTATGEVIRNLVLSTDSNVCANAEILLMFAARAQHLEEVIMPNIRKGRWVVCDRFTDSTFAYQGGGRQVSFDRIEVIENWVQSDFRPDLTLLFDADIETAAQRVRQQDDPDRIESEAIEFQIRVRDAFKRLQSLFPERIISIDSTQAISQVSQQAQKHVRKFIDHVST